MKAELELAPGIGLLPPGWWETTFIPWADAQTDINALKNGSAQLDGYIHAYRGLGHPTLELERSLRYLEMGIGKLLGPAKTGVHLDGSIANEPSLTKDERHQFRKLHKHRTNLLQLLHDATDPEQISRAKLLAGGAHISNNSGQNEWYTPVDYIAAATNIMGAIDLDPASSETANAIVGATTYYDETTDGLTQQWKGRVWMNPPYAQPLIEQFCTKLRDEYVNGNVTEACALVNNATETAWFQTLGAHADAICFPMGRVKFWHPDRVSAPLQGQAVIYLGGNRSAFREEFSTFGILR